ncbi:MAG TPA: HupE/UreJ family protein [Cyclobacteriaceae bacterium]|nr:HupE/UreJ family protein [Cyclobacteriaceae bacterium]HMV07688.1 HupE/UreJ family protein [Cyclobacteriaceae bacterium]HMV88489.1 HupE/UreJ family protein [Cyclobacteriaceae bacterium]HMW98823.1 HupE/UreJ family protein [Cyclobacteriaceae bacterium]HMX48544.1 HupE/UreJ family protein [Cyclobacteriaceae bacterium]
MGQFELYFQLGKEHILDYKHGYDHILFIVALCAVYLMRDWKKILILVTAFTIGHSITLALSTLEVISFNQELIEFLIPVTIFITAASNIFRSTELSDRTTYINYGYALFFGLIHGMGFSNYLKTILGKSGNIVTPLFAFNVGLELGQIIIVSIFLIISFILVDLFTVNRRDWKMVLSAAIAGMALLLMKDKIFW